MKWLLFLLFAVTCQASSLDSYKLFRADGQSMGQAIPDNSVVISKPYNGSSVKVGQIIIFEHDNQLVCHQVISVNPIVTQGWANDGADVCDVKPLYEVLGWTYHDFKQDLDVVLCRDKIVK